MKPTAPAQHPRHLAEVGKPAELLRLAMLTLVLRGRRMRQMRLELKK